MYSPLILEYANKVLDEIVIPDEIVISEGVACGDALVAQGEVSNGVVRFSITATDGCLLSRAMASYLSLKGSGKRLEAVKRWVLLIKSVSERDARRIFDRWDIPYMPERLECLTAPVNALIDLVTRLSSRSTIVCAMKDTEKKLDCDACVRSSSVLWVGDTAPRTVYAEEDQEVSDVYREKWCRVSKCRLDGQDKVLLHDLVSRIQPADMTYIRHEKMAQCVFSNIVHEGMTDLLMNQQWKIMFYQIHRKEVVKREVEKIADFVKGIEASFIKGMSTGPLYSEDNSFRVHLDYDILCFSEHAAWELGCFLLRRGFLMFKDVFSLKRVDVGGVEVVQGHFHMQKVLDDQYKLVVDVNSPGFPVGRIGLFYPNYTGLFVSHEDQFVITLCHTFKHRNVYMKDLNDLYLMSTKWEMDRDKLAALIQDTGLGLFASVALNYICSSYCVSAAERKRILSFVPNGHTDDFQVVDGWPYSARAMLDVKRMDLANRKQEQRDNPRTYLMPLVMVSTPVTMEMLDLVTRKLSCVSRVSKTMAVENVDGVRVLLTGMGCFLDKQMDSEAPVDRDRLRARLRVILEAAGIKHEALLPFAIAPQTGAWFF